MDRFKGFTELERAKEEILHALERLHKYRITRPYAQSLMEKHLNDLN